MACALSPDQVLNDQTIGAKVAKVMTLHSLAWR
jgi:hypothetical protein